MNKEDKNVVSAERMSGFTEGQRYTNCIYSLLNLKRDLDVYNRVIQNRITQGLDFYEEDLYEKLCMITREKANKAYTLILEMKKNYDFRDSCSDEAWRLFDKEHSKLCEYIASHQSQGAGK